MIAAAWTTGDVALLLICVPAAAVGLVVLWQFIRGITGR